MGLGPNVGSVNVQPRTVSASSSRRAAANTSQYQSSQQDSILDSGLLGADDRQEITEVLPESTVEKMLKEATDPEALKRALMRFRNLIESQTSVVSSGTPIFGMFGERFNEEGFHSEHPQIAAIHEFIPIFKRTSEDSELSISKTDLNKIISREDLMATPIHDLIEIQKLVRNSVVESTSELFKIFYKNYHSEEMSEENLQVLDANYQELFEFQNFVEITQQIDQKTEVFKDIDYNFSRNNIDNAQIVEKLKSDLSTNYLYYSEFVEKNIDTNPYISSVIGYYVLSRFAKGLVSVLKLLLENRETFLDSFYLDIIDNDNLLESSLNTSQDEKLIAAYRALDSNTLTNVNKSLRHFFKESIAASSGMIRFIKGMHGFASGFIAHAETGVTPFGDTTASSESRGGNFLQSSLKYLTNSRKCRIISFAFDAQYRAQKMNEKTHIDGYDALYSDNFDYGVANYDEESAIRALLPMIYDIKNTITFPNVKDAQADLIGKHLFGPSNSLESKEGTIKSNVTSTPPNPIDTTKDIVNMWYQDLNVDLSKRGMQSLDVGDMIYSDLQDGRNLLIVDNKGFTNAKIKNEDNVTMKQFAFAIADSLRDDGNNAEVSRICQKVQDAANRMITDMTENYGIQGLSDLSTLSEEYVNEFFEMIADELLNPMYNTPNNSGSVYSSVDHFVTSIMLLAAYYNVQFKKDLWKSTCWWYQSGGVGSEHYVRMSDPMYVIPGTGGTGLGIHDGYEKVRNSGYYGEGEPTGMNAIEEADVRKDRNSYHTHDPNEKFEKVFLFNYGLIGDPLDATVSVNVGYNGKGAEFTRTPGCVVFNYLYYNIIPGTRNTVGLPNSYEDGSKGLGLYGQWESASDANIFQDGSFTDFADEPRHFMNEDKGNTSSILIGEGGLDSTDLDSSITICSAKNLADPFKNVLATGLGDEMLIGKLLEFDGKFLQKYESDLTEKIGFPTDETYGQPPNLVNNDSQYITCNNALGTSSVSRSYLLYFILVRFLASSIDLKLLTHGREGRNDNDNQNGNRNIEIHFNDDQLQGVHDALKGYSKPSNPKGNYELGYDAALRFKNNILSRCKNSEAGLLASTVSLIKIRNFFGNLKNRTVESFDYTSVVNLREFIEQFDEDLAYLNAFSYDQRNLSTFLNLTMLNPSTVNFHLPSQKDITNDQVDCMKKFFSQDKYTYSQEHPYLVNKNSKKKYIMHLGITNSLIDTLRDRLIEESGIADFTLDANIQALKQIRDRSIITINLYRKNLVNDKSVQVRSYLFDINKYVIENVKHESINDIKMSTGLPAASSVGTFLALHRLYDFRSGIDSGSGREFAGKLFTNYKTVANDSRNNITEEEIERLYTNHFEDFYLKLYCKSITGLDFDDDVFINNNIASQLLDTNNQSLNVIQNYNAAFKSHLDDLLNLSGNDQTYINERYRIEKEAKRSLYFSTEKYMKRVLYPKTFDRIFSVFVDLSNSSSDVDSAFDEDSTMTLDRFYYTVSLTNKLALFDADPARASSSDSSGVLARVVTSSPQVIKNIQLVSPSSGASLLAPPF